MSSWTTHRVLRIPARSLAAGLVAFAVFALTILVASPAAHAWVHADHSHAGHDPADHPHPADDAADHVCAVTLAQQGFFDTSATLRAVRAPEGLVEHVSPVPPTIRWTAPEHWLQPAVGPPGVTN